MARARLDGATQALPAIYQLPSSDFHDITSGSNGAYSARPGYDLVTGLGTPRRQLRSCPGWCRMAINRPPSGHLQGPWVATPASATPSPVTGTTTNLSVLGGDSGGASSLTYTWSRAQCAIRCSRPRRSASTPATPPRTRTATFYAAGTYTFEATITDSAGLSITSDVTVTVNQTLSSLVVSPGNATVADGSTQQFTATAKDQFGNAMSNQPSFTWTLSSGSGTLGSTGLYTAPSSGTATATVQAAANGLSATASVTFGSAPAAPANLTAMVISTHQVNLAWTDNAGNATGIVVQRSTNGTSWSTLATLAGTATSYSDTSVSKNKTYYYRVYADNSFGNSSYSNVVTATTSSTSSSGSGTGGGHGGKNGGKAWRHVNAFHEQRQFATGVDMLWAEVNYVDALLTSLTGLWTHGNSVLGHAF